MLLICIEVLRGGFFCFPVRDWEGFCRKLFKKCPFFDDSSIVSGREHENYMNDSMFSSSFSALPAWNINF